MQLLNTLYITTPETYLRLDNDTLRVEVDQETRLRVPLHHHQRPVEIGRIVGCQPKLSARLQLRREQVDRAVVGHAALCDLYFHNNR